jgi:hypothetical protein
MVVHALEMDSTDCDIVKRHQENGKTPETGSAGIKGLIP